MGHNISRTISSSIKAVVDSAAENQASESSIGTVSSDTKTVDRTNHESTISISSLTKEALADWDPIRALATYDWCIESRRPIREYLKPMDIVKLLYIRWVSLEDIRSHRDAISMVEHVGLDELAHIEPPKLKFEMPSKSERHKLAARLMPIKLSGDDRTGKSSTAAQNSQASDVNSLTTSGKRRHREDSPTGDNDRESKRLKEGTHPPVPRRRKDIPDHRSISTSSAAASSSSTAPPVYKGLRPRYPVIIDPSKPIILQALPVSEQIIYYRMKQERLQRLNEGATVDEMPDNSSKGKKRLLERTTSPERSAKRTKLSWRSMESGEGAPIASEYEDNIFEILHHSARAGPPVPPWCKAAYNKPDRCYLWPQPDWAKNRVLIYYKDAMPPPNKVRKPVFATAEEIQERKKEAELLEARKRHITLFGRDAPVFGRPTSFSSPVNPAVGNAFTRNPPPPPSSHYNRYFDTGVQTGNSLFQSTLLSSDTSSLASSLARGRSRNIRPVIAFLQSRSRKASRRPSSRNPANRPPLPGPSGLRNEIYREPSTDLMSESPLTTAGEQSNSSNTSMNLSNPSNVEGSSTRASTGLNRGRSFWSE